MAKLLNRYAGRKVLGEKQLGGEAKNGGGEAKCSHTWQAAQQIRRQKGKWQRELLNRYVGNKVRDKNIGDR